MKVEETELPGLLLIETRLFHDERGHFQESWNQRRYAEAGIPSTFVQDNVSWSRQGVLRGMHYQWPQPQGKLVSVLRGEVFDAAVDLRSDSPTFGQWTGFELSADNGRQLYIPEGFAHGFVVLSADAVFSYKCTDYYAPEAERTLLWDDPEVGVQWPVQDPVLSPKDQTGTPLEGLKLRQWLPGKASLP